MSNATVILYGAPLSTCTRRVATVLKEKNVPYELKPIDLAKGEHKDPKYMEELQPFGQVPVLKVSVLCCPLCFAILRLLL